MMETKTHNMDPKPLYDYIPLSLLLWNANGLRNKIDELTEFITQQEPDIVAINETHAKPSYRLKIPDYNIFRTDRIDRTGGGSAIYVRKDLTATLHSTKSDTFEQTSIVVQLPDNSLIKIISMYNPPDCIPDLETFKQLFSDSINTILLGDLNSKHEEWGCRKRNRNGQHLYDIIDRLNLTLHVPNENTYYPDYAGRLPDILDIMITNMNNPFSSHVHKKLNSDHLPVSFSTNINVSRPPSHRQKTNWDLYENILKTTGVDLPDLNCTDNIDKAINIITTTIQGAQKDATVKIPITKKYWKLPPNIIADIKMRNKIKKEWTKTLNPATKNKVNYLTKRIKQKCQKFKNETWNEKVEGLTTDNNSIWKMSKTLKSKNTTNMPLKGPNGDVYSDKDKANIFANTMEQQFSTRDNPNCKDFHAEIIKKYNTIVNDNAINTMNTATTEEIQKIISKLRKNKAPGYDNINNIMMKKLPAHMLQILCNIYNACIHLKYFPKDWKHSSIILLPKPGKNTREPENHRPISLLPTMSKILEKIILNRINPFLINLPNQQYGFRNKLSTSKQLLRLINFIAQGFYKKCATATVFLDVAKAFDRVWHAGLIVKLQSFGLPTDIIQLLNSYLTNRTFNIKLNKTQSDTKNISAGVPQGSILGPILYIIYNADFPMSDGTQELTALYADDTAILYQSRQPNFAIKQLQKRLDDVQSWCTKWKIKINADKSNLLIFRKHKPKAILNEQLNLFNTNIPTVNETKYLGVTLTSNLKWNKHIDNSIRKAQGAFHALKPLINKDSKLDLRNKRLIYTSCIRPILTYACPAWGNIPKSLHKKLDAFQNKILKTMTGAPKRMSITRLSKELKIDKLSQYISKLNASFFGEAINCNMANFNNMFNQELIESTTNYNPIASFLLSDGILSREFNKFNK